MKKSTNPLFESFANKYSIDPDKVGELLKATAFKQRKDTSIVTDEQMLALLIVADQYSLNPFTREIYAFEDTKKGGIVPIVGIDGWSKIINLHLEFDGLELRHSDVTVTMPGAKPCPEWMECLMYRKDRKHPTVIREYLDETFNAPFTPCPWQTHTKRSLRHKTIVQTARVAFGFVGIYDQDEAERIINGQSVDITPPGTQIMPTGSVVVGDPSPAAVKTSAKLIARATDEGSWDAALAYVKDSYNEPDRSFMLSQINEAWNKVKIENGSGDQTPNPRDKALADAKATLN